VPPQIVETDEKDWFFPRDSNIDLAIRPMAIAPFVRAMHIPTNEFLGKSQIADLDVRLGDDVVMIGRHLEHDGRYTNMPTARFGHIAQFPGVPIKDERGRSQSSYLVQIPSMGGYSGSPVFLFQNLSEKNAENGVHVMGVGGTTRLIKLLGVNKGHLPTYAPTYLSRTNQRNEHIDAEINSGIAVVVPAWELASCISDYLAAHHPS
jgi:hypothetical protein